MDIWCDPSLENVERQRLDISSHQTTQARPVGDPNKFIPVPPVTGIGCGRRRSQMAKQMKAIGMVVVAMLFVAGMAIAQDRYGGWLPAEKKRCQQPEPDRVRPDRPGRNHPHGHKFATPEHKKTAPRCDRCI